MFSVLFETKTSVYRLEMGEGKFRLTKVALKPGFESAGEVGVTRVGDELAIDSQSCLTLKGGEGGGWSTSPIVSPTVDECRS